MEQVTLYTTHCPKCEVLKRKLTEAQISYKEVDDTAEIMKVAENGGFTMAPLLQVGEEILDFSKAVSWIKSKI